MWIACDLLQHRHLHFRDVTFLTSVHDVSKFIGGFMSPFPHSSFSRSFFFFFVVTSIDAFPDQPNTFPLYLYPQQIPQPNLAGIVNDIFVVLKISVGFIRLSRLRAHIRHLDSIQAWVNTTRVLPAAGRRHPHSPRRDTPLLLRPVAGIRVCV